LLIIKTKTVMEEKVDLSFLELTTCQSNDCGYYGTYLFELGCSHTICINHVLIEHNCPTCKKEINLDKIKVPGHLPGKELIEKLLKQVSNMKQEIAQNKDTVNLLLTRQYYLINNKSGRQSPSVL